MGNRGRYRGMTVGAAGVSLAARRRTRLRKAAEGIRASILPTNVLDLPTERDSGGDESHAPRHQHVAIDDVDERGPRRLPGRPWTKHAHGMRHPFSGD